MSDLVGDIKAAVFPSAFALLPEKMDSTEARAMLIAITLQEARAKHRKQIGGPAKGLWQFERGGGVNGVLNHPAVRDHAFAVCAARNVTPSAQKVYDALETDDVLACCFARLLLWTVPGSLPKLGEYDRAWEMYLNGWRPGRPHRITWNDFFDKAWDAVS